jgi:hypothetical protein
MPARLLRRHTLYYPRLLTLTLQGWALAGTSKEKWRETGSQSFRGQAGGAILDATLSQLATWSIIASGPLEILEHSGGHLRSRSVHGSNRKTLRKPALSHGC